MLSLRLGTDDLGASRAFYDATLATIGVAASALPAEYPILLYKLANGVSLVLGKPRDGQPATHANGGTVVLTAQSNEAVAAWHAAGLANGGTCEGPPEVKPQAGGAFGAYMRDPSGNKLGCYHGLSMG